MRWTFWGAAREVTGSNHLIEVGGQRVLMDCGLFQGRREEARAKNVKFGYEPKSIDSVVLGHAHTDHAGNLPGLSRGGYSGAVHCTAATRDLAAVMLQDSAMLQERDAEHLNKYGRGGPLVQPLYEAEDAQRIVAGMATHPYHAPFSVAAGIRAQFFDAGHILGSALTLLEFEENGRTRKVFYGCDVGRAGMPILRDPDVAPQADVLVLESTYGDRLHPSLPDAEETLVACLSRAAARKAKVVIPAFSLGRTQELLYSMHRMVDQGRLPRIPVYVDSPLSASVTDIFRLHPECFDKEMNDHLRIHPDPLGFAQLHTVRSVEDSKKLNAMPGPMVIVSASGMAEGGRVLHHLANTISDPENMVLIVGFMAENTLGRRILEKRPEVRIYGEMVPLRAEVVVLSAFSAHGDQADLLRVASQVRPERIYLVHGEPVAQAALQAKLNDAGFANVEAPARGQAVEI